MKNSNEKVNNLDDITPLETRKEWKLLYHQPGRPGLEEGSKFKGICRYCELKDMCPLPKPEGGVWRCSYYNAFQKKSNLHNNVLEQLKKAKDVVHFDDNICKILTETMNEIEFTHSKPDDNYGYIEI